MIGARGLRLLPTLMLVVACGQAPDAPGEAAPASALTNAAETRSGIGPRSGPGAHHVLETATTCAPKDIAFAPRAWVPPGPTRVPACTAAQVRTVAGCVWANGTTTSPACNAFWESTQNEACLKCAYTSAGDPVHGPIFDDGQWVMNNYPACIAAASGDRAATSCGARFEALLDCWGKACEHCADDAAYWACTEASEEGMCKPYRDGWTCAAAYEGTCFADTEADAAVKLISLLCAP